MMSKKETALGNRRMKEFISFVERLGLNFHKVMCLRWQRETGQRCTNRKHMRDQYKNEMECEASLSEAIAMNLEFSGLKEETFREFMDNMKKEAND